MGDAVSRQLLTLGDDLERLWDHPNSPGTLKKHILRTALRSDFITGTPGGSVS
jgi:hypothetical protein